MRSTLGIDTNELGNWTLFLDRDGVINKRIMDGYVRNPMEFEYLHHSPKAIARFSQLFKHVFVVTNQQGVGKGLMTLQDVHNIHRLLQAEVKHHQGRITQFYVCPHLASENSPLRKPEIGMALQAKQDFPDVDFSRSIMVGDSLSDMEFGRKAGMRTVFVNPDPGYTNPLVDFVIQQLNDLLNLLNTK